MSETYRKGNLSAYNRALVMFYDIDIEKFSRYPEFYGVVIDQADGIIFLEDIPGTHLQDGEELLSDPITAFISENFESIFGTRKINKNFAMVYFNSELMRQRSDKAFQKAVKLSLTNNVIYRTFPGNIYRKINRNLNEHILSNYPHFYNSMNRMIDSFTRRNFIIDELPDECTANVSIRPETPLLWLLAALKIIPYKGKL